MKTTFPSRRDLPRYLAIFAGLTMLFFLFTKVLAPLVDYLIPLLGYWPTILVTFVLGTPVMVVGVRLVMRTVRTGRWARMGQKKSALRLLDALSLLLPSRISKEDLGDYIEEIRLRGERGQRWQIWVLVIAAILWTGINTAGFVTKSLLGKSEERSDKKTSN